MKWRRRAIAVAMCVAAAPTPQGAEADTWDEPDETDTALQDVGLSTERSPFHSRVGLTSALDEFVRSTGTALRDGAPCEWLPLRPEEFGLLDDAPGETVMLSEQISCDVDPPGFPALAQVLVAGRPCDRTISFGIGGAPVFNEPRGAGYFVSQERRTERDDGTVYAYVWAGWQAPGACFAVRLVIDQRLGEEATTNRAASYLAALEEGLRPYQLAAHLPEVESVSDAVRSQLPLAEGSSGAAVAELQELLISSGISVGDSGVDGSYGRDTAIAVALIPRRDGQEVMGSDEPGELGVATDDAIDDLETHFMNNVALVEDDGVCMTPRQALTIIEAETGAGGFRAYDIRCSSGWAAVIVRSFGGYEETSSVYFLLRGALSGAPQILGAAQFPDNGCQMYGIDQDAWAFLGC